METPELFVMPDCPLCGETHEYLLNVRRTQVLSADSLPDYFHNLKSFRRLFTCPKTKTDFEVLLALPESSYRKIESLEVSGLAEQNNGSRS